MKFGQYYREDPKTKAEKRMKKEAEDKREIADLRQKVEAIPQLVEDRLAVKVCEIVPALLAGLDAWNAAGRQGPVPLPSMTGSNSTNKLPPVFLPTNLPSNATGQPILTVTPPANTAPQPVALVTPPANTAAQLVLQSAPVRDNTPAGTVGSGSSASVSCTPAVVGGASTLAELDAVSKVTKRLRGRS